jgi:hypothetical protein
MEHTEGKLYIRYDSGLATLHPENDIGGLVVIAEIDPNKQNDILAKANAHRLVKCWNSHDKLLEACKKINEIATDAQGDYASVTETYSPTWTLPYKEIITITEQAIAESE